MDDLSSDLAGFKEKTTKKFDKTKIEKSGNVTAKKEKQSVNKVRDSQLFKDIKTEFDNKLLKKSSESDISITYCTDEENDLLVANCCLGLLVHNKELKLKNKAVETTTRPTFGLSKKDVIKRNEEFCTQVDMHRFEEGLKSAGPLLELSVGSHNLKLGTYHLKNGSSTKLKEDNTVNVSIAITAYSFVPLITFELFESNLRLTPLALEDIRKIENLSNMGVKNKAIMDSCCKFIETFGSHVSTGSIDVGGICCLSTTYDSKTKMNIEKCQDIARRAHTGYIQFMKTATAEVSYHAESDKNKATEEITEESKLVHSCTQLSYPLNDCNYAEWSNNLIKHPGAWRVLNRGSPTGIWNILLNHSDDIQGCYQIAAMIRNAWQNKWNQNPDEVLDQVVTCAISSISDFLNNDIILKSFSRKNVVQVIEKLTLCASLNNRFKEYWSVGKFVPFFQNAVSQSNELHLKHKVCLKILLGLLSDSALNEHEDIVKWFTSPLFRCRENIFEAIIHFMTNAMKPVYTDLSYEDAEKHWKRQVNEQITTEIGIIFKHHGDYFNDNKQCIYIARCLAKLGFDFEKMQRSYLHGDYSVEDFFIAITQKTVKSSASQDLQLENKMIERDFFRALHISKSIYKKYNELQLHQAFFDELSNLCEKTLKETGDQLYLGTALQIATLGFDLQLMKFSPDIDPFSSIIEEQFKIYALVWNLQNGHSFFDDLSCYHVISALNSVFIKTVETLEQKFPKCIEEAQSYIFSLRLNILTQLQNTRTKTSVQRECIMLEIIFSKAFQNMTKKRVFQLNSSREFRILVDDMASSLNKSSKQVSLYPRPIPSNQDPFVVFLRECVLSLWRNSRTQMVNRCKSDTGHEIKVFDEFFKRELEFLCSSSLRSCLVTKPRDIRSNIVQNLCNQSTVTCIDVESFLAVHNSRLKWLIMRIISIFQFLYDQADQLANSTISAFKEMYKKKNFKFE